MVALILTSLIKASDLSTCYLTSATKSFLSSPTNLLFSIICWVNFSVSLPTELFFNFLNSAETWSNFCLTSVNCWRNSWFSLIKLVNQLIFSVSFFSPHSKKQSQQTLSLLHIFLNGVKKKILKKLTD